MTALAVVCMTAGSFIPLLGSVLLLFTAIPITVLVVRQNFTIGAIAAVAGSFICMLILGPYRALSFLLRYMSLGLVVGYMFAKHKGAGKSIIAAMVTAALGTTILTGLGFVVGGFTVAEFSDFSAEITDEMLSLYEQTGMMEQLRQQGFDKDDLRDMVNSMMAFLPSMWVIMSAMGGVIHFILARMVFRRLKLKIPRMPAFTTWHLPFNAVWGLIVFWAIWLGEDLLGIPWLHILAQNVLLIYGVLLMVMGFSVVAHYMDLKNMSSMMKVLTVFFLLFFFYGAMILCALAGLVDLLLDFRKVRPKNQPKQKS